MATHEIRLNIKTTAAQGYAPVNGLKMYYEIQGTGDPLVCIPPAFGYAGLNSYPALMQSHRIITVDLQGHGRTLDIPERPLSIEQYAEDVVGLLKYLGISKADFFGESYGGNAAAMIAIRYPELVGRVVTYAATFGPPQIALDPQTTHFDHPPTADSRNIQFQRENYKKVAPDPNYWPKIFDKLGSLQWEGFSNEELASIKAPMLIVSETTILSALSTPLRPSSSSPTPNSPSPPAPSAWPTPRCSARWSARS